MAFFARMGKQSDEKTDEADEQTPAGKRVLRLKEFLKCPLKINVKGNLSSSTKELYRDGFLRLETPCAISSASVGKVVPMRNAESFIRNGKQICGLTFWFLTNWDIPDLPYWEKSGFGDVTLVPDMDTMKVVGYQPEMCRVICDQVLTGERAPCPRTVCKDAMAQLKKEFGLELLAASEFEFQLLRKKTKEELAAESKQDIPKDEGTDWVPCWDEYDVFSTRETMKQMEFVRDFEKAFLELGVDLNAIHTEYAPGQLEVSIKPALGIASADNAFTYKTGIKEIADKRKILATFMSKPFGAISTACANGGHFNHSLWKTSKDGTKMNVFYQNGELSDIAKWWIGGIFKHHDALCAMANPTENCYERLKDFSWAPTRESWGVDNRTVLVRAQARSEFACWLEYRAPSAAQNPYNLYAAIVHAGMDGLRNKINPGPPTYANGYKDTERKRIPETLESSLKCLEKSKLFIDAFGKDFIDMYCTVKRMEIAHIEDNEKKIGKIRARQEMYLSNA